MEARRVMTTYAIRIADLETENTRLNKALDTEALISWQRMRIAELEGNREELSARLNVLNFDCITARALLAASKAENAALKARVSDLGGNFECPTWQMDKWVHWPKHDRDLMWRHWMDQQRELPISRRELARRFWYARKMMRVKS